MFDIGFWEMAIIGIIALVVIGPERLPGAAHRVGIWVGKSRRMLNEVMSDVKKEMKEYDVEQVKNLGKEFKSAGKQLKDITQSTTDSLDLKAVGNEFKESIEEISSTPSPSVQKTGTTNKKTKRKPATKTDSIDLKAVGSEFKESIEEISSTPSPSVQKTGTTNKKTKRKPATKTAIKKPVSRKKTKTKGIKKTASKKPTTKAASPTSQKK